MKNSKKRKILEMERQDALGISRKNTSRSVMSVKAYQIVRLSLVVLTPLVYFLCSPFLIVVLLLWIVLLFVSRSIEKKYNDGLKKDLQTKLPKTDSTLCIILIVIVAISVAVSSFSMTSRASKFEGMNSEQLQEIVGDFKFDESEFVIMQIVNKIKDIGSLTTGTRWLFQSERNFMGGPGGGPSNMEGFKPPSGSPPEGFTPPSGKPDMGEMLSNMPFSMVFSSIMKAVCTAGLVVICIVAVLSVIKVKKMNIDERELSAKEKERLIKKEEARLKKLAEGKNFVSLQKTDYTELEKELLSDLSFLFELDINQDLDSDIELIEEDSDE